MIVPLVLLCAACFACGLVLGVIAMSVATAMTQHEHDAKMQAEAWDEGWAARAEFAHRRDVPLNWPHLNPYRAQAVSTR